MALNIQDTSYAGIASAYLITRPVAAADTFNKGACVMQETNKQFVLRRLEISNFIQPYNPTPADNSTLTFDATIIPIYQYNLYTEFNPLDLKETWSSEYMQKELIDLPLAQNDSTYLMAHMFDLSNLFIDQLIWRGDTNFDLRSSNPVAPTTVGLPSVDGGINQSTLSVINGWIDQIQNSPTAINLPGYVLTGTNSVAALQTVYNAVQTSFIGEYGDEGLRFLFNKRTQTKIEQNYNITVEFKNWSYDSNVENFAFLGYEMISISGMPDNTIIATYANRDPLRSQLFFCYNAMEDQTNLKMAQKAANSDIWFIKGTIKIGVGYGFPDQVICWSNLNFLGN